MDDSEKPVSPKRALLTIVVGFALLVSVSVWLFLAAGLIIGKKKLPGLTAANYKEYVERSKALEEARRKGPEAYNAEYQKHAAFLESLRKRHGE